MRAEQRDLLFVMIPPNSDEAQAELENLHPEGFLAKPFYLPDMIETVEKIITQKGLKDQAPITVQAPTPVRINSGPLRLPSQAPAWLTDVNRAAQHLTRLTLESASQAALITKADVVWAYAGELPRNAAEELARTVAYFFSEDVAGDMARYVRLESTDAEVMVYATSLGAEFVLAVVFDAEMPFSRIRNQANDLAKALAVEEPTEDRSTLDAMDEVVSEAALDAAMAGMIEPLWEDVPPPNLPNDWLPRPETATAREGFLDDLINDRPARGRDPQPMFDPFPREKSEPQRAVASREQRETDLDGETIPSEAGGIKTLPEYIAETMVSRSREAQGLDVTMPSGAKADFKKPIKLAPADPILYDLTYACVLVPRLPHHYLTGDLATSLSNWVTQLSLAFGWRLEQLAIRPEYLQWMANVPPKTSPGYLMRIMRDHTSRRIFTEFGRLLDENPSRDFWAPGYLIMGSNQTPPQQLINDFIQETRNRQGVYGQ
jgi:REP element-mobilizing transposase RayT